MKVGFCDTSHTKCLVFHFQTSRFQPKNHQKTSMTSMMSITKFTFFGPQYIEVPDSIENQQKSKPGAQSGLSCGPQCPKIVRGSHRPPKSKWRHQACQMTSSDTKNLRYVCKIAKNLQSELKQYEKALSELTSRSQRANANFSREI